VKLKSGVESLVVVWFGGEFKKTDKLAKTRFGMEREKMMKMKNK